MKLNALILLISTRYNGERYAALSESKLLLLKEITIIKALSLMRYPSLSFRGAQNDE